MKTFTTMMNMPKPLAIASLIIIFIRLILTQHFKVSMESAANEVRMSIEPGASESHIVDCQVSIDSSWYKRGHSSMNGFVSAISKENNFF